ncbi:hypothetical protein HH310_02955 [Actinoplanes sp. TBRC 11911]|uniref:hypothetical protein n=1 Tax=Actinoplanes sp. TBRC 11911 TaxID=2729386 RepID=UPI00145F8AAF|nr:hypothetical protein [Actinoplanes sp. TBRC 11911]NMO50150.1 hypothetical protein [Actinoplanes sp. TBRC 11911]
MSTHFCDQRGDLPDHHRGGQAQGQARFGEPLRKPRGEGSDELGDQIPDDPAD